jgi:Zn finger protein HypA/HybF involved in hydrogenase expression
MNRRAQAQGWARTIEAAQLQETEEIGGKTYQRIRAEGRCRDCDAASGQYHVVGCTVERCPACGSQAFGCSCYAAPGMAQ